MDEKNIKELKPEELEKASGGSIHFPHIGAPGEHVYCPKCYRDIFTFPNGATDEEKQQKINEHMREYHGA